MSNFVDPYILFQYRSTDRLRSLLEGTKDFSRNESKASLYNFFDLDSANGLWLDQLGDYLNIERLLVEADNVFIMDQSLMDSTDILDGTAPASDEIFLAFIRAQIFRRNSRFTINDVIEALDFVIDARFILIDESVKTVSIFLGLNDDTQLSLINILSQLNPKWFGLPSGVGLTRFEAYVIPPEANFFIMDQSIMDNNNFLMV